MQRRIFIAINLPENTKKKIKEYEEKWPDLPIRWTKKENIHITLDFLGHLTDEDLFETCKIAKEVSLRHAPFSVNLNEITYGPPKKLPPRMVWIKGKENKDLSNLQNDIEKSLLSLGSENKSFSPHITLGRIKTWEWQKLEPEERPIVDEDINLNFEVTSIDIMESELKKEGPIYTILESCPLS